MISGSQAWTVRGIGPRFRSGKLLIFRFTPLGLVCPTRHASLLENLLNERVHLNLWGENHPAG